MMILEHRNIKTFLPKVTFQIDLENFFMIRKVKHTELWTYVISDTEGEVTVGMFYEKELQKANQNEFRVEK